MAVNGKRMALNRFCDSFTFCGACPLNQMRNDEFETNVCFFSEPKGAYGYWTDDQINAAYAIAFPEKDCTGCTHVNLVSSEFPCKECSRLDNGEHDMYVTEAEIADSGDRTLFETGACRDMHEGKGRMDLLPWSAIMEVSKHCENGAKKYGEHNVDKGIPTSSLCDSAARHLAKYLAGWTDEPHLLAAVWNLLWAVEMTIKHPELVNTPWKDDGNVQRN